ncbi:LacI family DNA-binding transcriptional regulator [Lachnoclostridium sp. Marseille-P6806]|uniref:LacI family DNA-binding transcriptional regulator n=1 Tax=Lachnoclostridium sp. Marseille-P6806 TaxID=2364793 RepID=UPI00102FB701|nr:LacI family DNA-binding transcriptional regulator [Lachnoclostridium sp. Marseille-P6806]
MKRGINIYQIASEAGVSSATVSRVMSGNPHVSEEKRRRVEEVIRRYDYRPNALAQGLTMARTRIIGVVAADVQNPYYAQIVATLGRRIDELEYSALIFNTFGSAELEVRGLQKMFDIRADAIILMGGRSDRLVTDPDYADLINRISDTVPVVTTGKVDGARVHQVCIDEMLGVDLAMEHLFSLGHRHIAMLGGRSDVKSTYEKRARYRSVLRSRGITYRERYVIDSDYNMSGGYRGMNELFASNIGRTMPTAIMAINDFSAVGVVHAIRERGLSVPEDMAVLSFDNTFLTETALPQLTSVGYDYEVFGRALADTAIDLVEGREVPASRVISSGLYARASTKANTPPMF